MAICFDKAHTDLQLWECANALIFVQHHSGWGEREGESSKSDDLRRERNTDLHVLR